MKTIRVFISTSDDLGDVRLAVMDLLVQLNRFFKTRGIEFLPALPSEGPISGDLAVALYWKDFGGLPQTDFERTYDAFKEDKSPKIYVFFRDPDAGITEALKAFKDSFGDSYGHFFCHFETVDSVKFQLTAQNLSLLPGADEKGEFKVENGAVLLGGETVAKLENLSFAKLNNRRKDLLEDISNYDRRVARFEEEAAAAPEDADVAESLKEARKKRHDLKEELKQYDGFLVGAAVFFAKASAEEMDERVRKARELFEQGKVQAANQILDLTELCASADRNLATFEAQREACEKVFQALLAKAEMVLVDGSIPMVQRIDDSCKAYEKAIRIAREIKLEGVKLAEVLSDYAILLQNQRRFQASIPWFLDVLKTQRRLDAECPGIYEKSIAMTLMDLAFSYRHAHQPTEAEKTYKDSLEICRRLVSVDSEAYESSLVIVLNSLACLHASMQHLDEAIKEYKEVLEICQRRMTKDPDGCKPIVAMALNDLAILQKDTQIPDVTEKEMLDALEIYQRLSEKNQEVYIEYVAWTLHNLAVFHSDMHRLSEAEDEYDEALKIYRQLASINQEKYEPDMVRTLHNLAELYCITGRQDVAERAFSEVLKIYRRLAITDPDEYEFFVACVLNTLAEAHRKSQRMEEAEHEYRDAIEIYQRFATESVVGYEPYMAETLCNWALMKRMSGHDEEARRLAGMGLDIYKKCEEQNPGEYVDKVKLAQSIAYGEEVSLT